MSKTPKVLFESHARVGGYGSAYQNFMLELLRGGVDLVDPNEDKSALADVHVYLGQPDRRWQNEWKRRGKAFGVFTMFETELLPPTWAQDINDICDFVIVPSRWCKEIFERNKVGKPVFVVPLGVNPSSFFYLERPERDTFTVIWQGFHEKDRKGFAILEKVFDELGLPNSLLIKKISPFSLFSPVQYDLRHKHWAICKNMTQAEMLMLLRQADLSVNPTSGEGFGLIPLEHMATGLPVIVSENSGCLDYRNPLYNIGIECEEGLSWFGEDFGKMMVPSPAELKAKIQWTYDHKDETREMGRRASEWVRKEWTYEKATQKLLEVINGFVS